MHLRPTNLSIFAYPKHLAGTENTLYDYGFWFPNKLAFPVDQGEIPAL
jgi:hypothetical protein